MALDAEASWKFLHKLDLLRVQEANALALNQIYLHNRRPRTSWAQAIIELDTFGRALAEVERMQVAYDLVHLCVQHAALARVGAGVRWAGGDWR